MRNRKTTLLPGRAGSGGRASSTDFSAGSVWSPSRIASSSAGTPAFVSAATAAGAGTAGSIMAAAKQSEIWILMLGFLFLVDVWQA